MNYYFSVLCDFEGWVYKTESLNEALKFANDHRAMHPENNIQVWVFMGDKFERVVE